MRRLVWSRTAKETYLDILLDIQETWGDDTAVEFAEKVESTLKSIQRMPYMFQASPSSPDKKIRRWVISKQTSLFYKVEEDRVDLITFHINRMNDPNLNK